MADALELIRRDVTLALKAGDRDRAGALRLVVSELQKAEKEGGDDEQAVLRRERKRRLDAAEQFAGGGREDLAARERAEADMIAAYLPAELSDEELATVVDEALAGSGATGPGDMGRAMGAVMGRVAGRADGRRVSALVRERLSGA